MLHKHKKTFGIATPSSYQQRKSNHPESKIKDSTSSKSENIDTKFKVAKMEEKKN